ncbi:MAG: MoaD/ThiS family protein [Desulfatiglandales bacterium]
MITIKVFPTLRPYLPPGIPGKAEFPLDLADLKAESVSIRALIEHLGLSLDKVSLAIINGIIMRDLDQVIKDGDVIVLSPAIGGG